MVIHNPLHTGEIIREILKGANLSIATASKKLNIHRTTLSKLLNGHSKITPEMALRLSILFPNTNAEFWITLQRDYETYKLTTNH